MISLSENELANGIHISLGANIVFLSILLGYGQWHGIEATIVWGVLKEAIFDPIAETPETSGGLVGGIQDFLGYIAGAIFAVAILYIRRFI